MTKVGMISLGCAKNLVDAEIMLGHLLKAGMTIVNDASQADVVIVNTCTFIDPAKKESISAVFDADEVRRHCHPSQALIVSGCMAQRYPDNLRQEMPEIDALMGLNEVPQVADIVKRALAHRRAAGPRKGRQAAQTAPLSFVSGKASYIPDYGTPRFRLTPPHMAFVKIAEGCNHPCTFCVIPLMRGRHRSRPVADIVKEARRLIADGVKELNLISQDTTYYGLDLWPEKMRDQRPFDHATSRCFTQTTLLPGVRFKVSANQPCVLNVGGASAPRPSAAKPCFGWGAEAPPTFRVLPGDLPTLCTLIHSLDSLDGDFWVRLLYTHPAHWSDELIETIVASKKAARYVDMPLQHIHPAMLTAMQRETSEAWIRDLIARIRRGIPGVALRTVFIVGFPGETERHFEHLLAFMREMRFERLGVFLYSREESSRAADLPHQVPEPVKRERYARAMALQQQLSRERNAAMVGRTLRVLVDKPSNKKRFAWIARSEADAPDIDGRVYLAEKSLHAGQFLDVTITGSSEYDVVAKP